MGERMDWLTFISTVIAAIAWPLVAMSAINTVRGHLPTIGLMVRKVKYKDVEVEFGKAVEAVAIEAEAFFPALEPTSTPTVEAPSAALSVERLDEIAKLSYRAAIIEAWDRVDLAARKVLNIIPRPWNHPWHFKIISEEFVEQRVLTKRQAEVYREMEILKYAVERYEARNIDEESVKKYIRSADVMESHLSAFLKQATESKR